jgi:hypothetical protein
MQLVLAFKIHISDGTAWSVSDVSSVRQEGNTGQVLQNRHHGFLHPLPLLIVNDLRSHILLYVKLISNFLSRVYYRLRNHGSGLNQVEVFWVVMPCSVVVGPHRFGGPC